MNLLVWPNCYTLILYLLSSSLPISKGATFTFVNKCDYTVWPGILANSGSPSLATTGFLLPSDTFLRLPAPSGWSGRFWGRTGCDFDDSASPQYGVCATGDCGSGAVECDGAGTQPPATLAEFTLGTGGQDFYDVSLVDGYNLPMLVEPSTVSEAEACVPTGCLVDLNRMCPTELRAGNGDACRSACDAFGSPEYCCSGAYASPATCKPTVYSELFKSACPRSYSYAFDDATSTFTCNAADYTITFCPNLPSQKSTTPVMNTPSSSSSSSSSNGSSNGSGSASANGSDLGSMNNNGSDSRSTTDMVGDGSWLAGLAMGDSTRKPKSTFLMYLSLVAWLSHVASTL